MRIGRRCIPDSYLVKLSHLYSDSDVILHLTDLEGVINGKIDKFEHELKIQTSSFGGPSKTERNRGKRA